MAVLAIPALVALPTAWKGLWNPVEGSPTSLAHAPATALPTATPIKHLVVIIGENHTFDNVFATYRPRPGQTVRNLLSEGIVTRRGRPGPNFDLARQWRAVDISRYTNTPRREAPYPTLPQSNAPDGPYRITGSIRYRDAVVGDPLHRFYEMWQQLDGGRLDLFTWVHQTARAVHRPRRAAQRQHSAVEMGYYDMQAGDAPVLRFLADHYAMSDNDHQAIVGGTAANHIAMGTGDMAYQQDAAGDARVPPFDHIENPNAMPGTNNDYRQDGHTSGSLSECANPKQPGVAAIHSFLATLPYRPFRGGDCAPGTYYLLNNFSPGLNPNGTVNPGTAQKPAISPQTFPTIGDELSAHGISWRYYLQGWNGGHPTPAYCGVCNWAQYSAKDMRTPSLRADIQGMPQLARDAARGTLPAVAFVKPDSIHDGHPASSALSLFERFTTKVIGEIMADSRQFASTAILITMDEGGGYYDSGYVQPIDFFGDGTRVPLIAVSPYTRPGMIDHTYTDHYSILKFIERNWFLGPLSGRSHDALPDPVESPDPYVPANRPAVGDLFSLFDFYDPQAAPAALPSG